MGYPTMINRLVTKWFCDPFNKVSLNDLQAFRHAFATPLTTLLFIFESSTTDHSDTSLTQTQIKTAKKAVQRLNELLSLAQVQEFSELRCESFDVIQAIKELRSFFYQKQLKLVVADELNENIFLSGHKLLFQEALINLIKNSFEAYPKEQKGIVLVTCYKLKNSLEIEIVDFAPHKKGHVPTKPFGGLGLGLPFARKVITKLFHGRLKLEVFRAKGAHANISLPLTP